MKKIRLLWSPVFGVLVFLVFSAAHGASVDIVASDAGFVTVAGGSAKADGTLTPSATFNYAAGYEVHYADGALGSPLAPMDRKNYFVFDLSGITDPISGAVLFLYNPGVLAGDSGDGYESADPTETFVLLETTDPGTVLGDLAMLASGTGPLDYDEATDPLVMLAGGLYGGLGDGAAILATATLSAADNGSTISMSFTSDGLAYLNGFLGSAVVLAGSVPTAVPPAPLPQEVFGFSGPDLAGSDPLAPKLVITTVPVPAAAWLFGQALGLLSWMRRR